jgi:glycosyltransferase involved in cell wall biosynthesis
VLRILFINVFDTLQGDVNGFLAAFLHLDPDRFERFALSNPRGAVYRKLQSSGQIHLTTAEMGGESGDPAQKSRLQRLRQFQNSIVAAIRIIREQHIDVVYTVDRSRAALTAFIAARITRRPLMISSNAYYFGASRVYRHVFRYATCIHCCSANLASWVGQYAADRSRVVVVPHGISLPRYDPNISGEQARKTLGVPLDAPLVLLPGRMVAYKGQSDLLTAAVSVRQRFPNTWFALIGQDSRDFVPAAEEAALMASLPPLERGISFAEYLAEQAQRDGIEDQTLIRGSWPWDDFPALLAAADIVAMPSWGEAFGLVALEGMAMAKPIVATSVDGVPEFVIDGQVGVLAPGQNPPALAEALLRLLGDPEKAREMGRRGRRHVEQHYAMERYVQGIETLLVSAAQRQRPPVLQECPV